MQKLVQNYDVDEVRRDLPEILRFRRVGSAQEEPLSTMPTVLPPLRTPPELPLDMTRNILSMRGGLQPFILTKDLASSMAMSALEQSCFGAVTEREIISSLQFAQANPGQEFEAGFFILTVVTKVARPIEGFSPFLYDLSVHGWVTALDNGVLRCKFGPPFKSERSRSLWSHYDVEFTITRPELFVDTLIREYSRTDEIVEHGEVLCFLPSLSSIESFISQRLACKSIPNYTKLYHNELLDAMLLILSKYPLIDRSIVSSYLGQSDDYYDQIQGLRFVDSRAQIGAIGPLLQSLKLQ